MNLNKEVVNKIFFSHIQNKSHLRMRKLSYLRVLITHIFDIFRFQIKKNPIIEDATLIFSSDYFLNRELFPGFSQLKTGAMHLCDTRNGWKFEEYLLSLGFVLNSYFRVIISNYVIKRVERKFNGVSFNAFVCSFPTPISYFIAIVLKKQNCKIFTFQHGIYLPDYYKVNYFEEKLADYNLVWGKVYEDCYISNNIEKSNIAIVCAPISMPKVNSTVQITPVFLGQQLYKILPHVRVEYNEILSTLIKFYKANNITLLYKPHPREVVSESLTKENISNLRILNKSSVSVEFFSNKTHAFSVNSTSLIHALSAGLDCYQIPIDLGVPNIDFSLFTSIKQFSVNHITSEIFNRSDKVGYIDQNFIRIDTDYKNKNSQLILDILAI